MQLAPSLRVADPGMCDRLQKLDQQVSAQDCNQLYLQELKAGRTTGSWKRTECHRYRNGIKVKLELINMLRGNT